jgi:hypothetical protein
MADKKVGWKEISTAVERSLSVGIQMRLPRDEGIVNVDIPSLTLYVFKSCYLSREHPDTAKNL